MNTKNEMDEYLVELTRVTDRLRTMPIDRLRLASVLTRPVLEHFAQMTEAPAPVPHLEDRALGDQLAVLGRDLANAQISTAQATELLRGLRRALP